MPSFPLLVRSTTWLFMAIAASLILYVFIGTDGETWTIQALNAAKNAGFAINLLAFAIIANSKRKWVLGLNFLFLLAMLVCGFLSVIDAIPGTDGRYGNHFEDTSAEIGLINYLAIALILNRDRVIAAIALPAIFILVTVYVYFAVAIPLKAEFANAEEQSTCIYRIDRVEWNKIAVERIHSPTELKLGLFIGEHSPRVAKVQGDRAFLFHYGSQEFSNSFGNDYVLRDLPSKLISLCSTSR